MQMELRPISSAPHEVHQEPEQETACDVAQEPPDSGAALRRTKKTKTCPKKTASASCMTLAPVRGQRSRRTSHSTPFVESDRTKAFREQYYPEVTAARWSDWRWQLANKVVGMAGLERVMALEPEERAACASALGGGCSAGLPLAVTPYYLSLLADSPSGEHSPLRRCMVPTVNELVHASGEAADPLGEEHDSPVPGLVHRYPDRVLFMTTDSCAAYCRYCTRTRLVGRRKGLPGRKRWQTALDYIASRPEIRDVILSGGDPLTMREDALEWLLAGVRNIPHVEVVRIGTKTPAVLPQRITPGLTAMLKKYHPLWMSLHCTHPAELTPEMQEACTRLADAGMPLGSQTVLLAGVNDTPATMGALFKGLMRMRVRPYYLYQCDPIPGSAHFRTPVSKGLEILQELRGNISGYAVPQYVIDAPGGGGKIPLLPETVIGRDASGNLLLRNYEGKTFSYPDFPAQKGAPCALA